jgi:hypothetical protein
MLPHRGATEFFQLEELPNGLLEVVVIEPEQLRDVILTESVVVDSSKLAKVADVLIGGHGCGGGKGGADARRR